MATRPGRSPRRPKSLPAPGQSLDEAIRTIVERDAHEAVVPAALLSLIAIWEWIRWLSPMPGPELLTAIALAAIGWASVKVRRARTTVQRLKLGLDSEREVADALEQLRDRGFRAFHDIPGPDFTVDHLLVGPQGLFLVETRTRAKPARGVGRIRYDGESLILAGHRGDRDAIQQAMTQARWVADLVSDSSGRNVFVRPVMLFPGWLVERIAKKTSVWVLNPRTLPLLVEREPTRLGPEDIQLIVSHVSQYLASGEKEPSRR
jgi:nuclease-like protein